MIRAERVALRCKRPFIKDGFLPLPCGRCTPCRVSKSQRFGARLLLEWRAAGGVGLSTTNTYAPEHLPPGGNVCRRDQQDYVRRVRKAAAERGLRVRVAGVAEYGRQTWRPHYHLQWIGLGWQWSEVVRSLWCDPETGELLGHVDVKPMDQQSIGYVVDHQVSCWSQRGDPRLAGREPEYFVWPRRPGLGVPAVEAIADALRDEHGAALIEREGDVPGVLMQGRKPLQLDRLMKSKLREQLVGDEQAARLAARRAFEFASRCRDGVVQSGGIAAWRVESPFVDQQGMLNRETRRRIFAKRESL